MSAAASAAATEEQRKRLLRSTLGSFATGVVVVSAAYGGREHGMTANSFTSVSLTPPLILLCTHNDARMTQLLECGMEFGLSVLAADQQKVSRYFSVRDPRDPQVDFAWARGVPLIAAAAAHLVCRLTESRVVGDHSVQIAAVEHFERFDRPPLVFHDGAYARLAPGA